MNVTNYHKIENITPIRQACMSTMKDFAKVGGHNYTFISHVPFKTEIRTDIRFETDEVRGRLACNDQEFFWGDSDLRWNGILFTPKEKGLPYFWKHDCCCFYVNGCSWFFKEMMKWYDANKKTIKDCGWFQEWIWTHKHYVIPDECFTHLECGSYNRITA